jgi:hypothetical protein
VNLVRRCEERSDEAIQQPRRGLDCFALLAMTMGLALAAATCAQTCAQARDFEMGGDNQYPYSIMAPEPGVAAHRHSAAGQSLHHRFYTGRGSSGSVLPTPLPRTPLMQPEGSGAVTLPAVPKEQPPIILQGSTTPIPSLPHGPETFQDRASRCAFQSGLYNVPGNLRTQYTGSCVQ